jgi:hypothetical protein
VRRTGLDVLRKLLSKPGAAPLLQLLLRLLLLAA